MEKHIKEIVEAIDEKFGIDTKVINIDKVSSITEYFIITNGKTNTQVRSISEEVQLKMDKASKKLLHSEGRDKNTWVLLDYGNIVVHIFNAQERDNYKLEELWKHGKAINIDSL